MNRVAITGVGVISPIGQSFATFTQNLFNGHCGIGPITTIPTERLLVKIAAEVVGFDPATHFEPRRIGMLDRVAQFALVATREAMARSALPLDGDRAETTACLIGTGVGGLNTLDDSFLKLYGQGAARVHPFTIPRLMVNAAASHITMEFGITGPAYSIASACSSAGHAIGHAFHLVRSGVVRAAVVGGAEACITVGTMKGWEAMRVMAPDTCRPFSKTRTGMVLGEGAAVFVLETLDDARARGAEVLAELAGAGMSSDAKDITAPDVDGGVRAIRAALRDAGLAAEDVDYVNAHGTGTAANDQTETQSLHRALGARARQIPVSSSKSMFGHALGAAGALELAATVAALRSCTVPPTVNYEETDPLCDLDYVPNTARSAPIRAALSNSFAFGGLNAVLAVRAV